MHDDQIRGLLRTLEDDRVPDPAFADALYRRLSMVADERQPLRAPFLLLAAALLTIVAAGIALGSGLLRLPETVDASGSPIPSTSGVAVASPSATASGGESPAASGSAQPSAHPDPTVQTGSILFAEAEGLRIRSEPSESGEVRATIRRGQLMGATGERREVDGTTWFEIRIGPGALAGWVAAGPDMAWLRLVEDGLVAFRCEDCGEAPAVVATDPFGDGALQTIEGESVQDFAWSPDGGQIAYVAIGDSRGVVFVKNADGSDVRRLGDGFAPRWSPDGTRLAWSNGEFVFVTDAALDPEALEIELRNPGLALWSPDGTRLGVAAWDCPECPVGEPIAGDIPTAIYVVDLTDANVTKLTGTAYDGLTSWAPDGSRIAFNRYDLSGEFPTRAMSVSSAGGEPVQFLDGSAVWSGPAWSPDGTRLAVSTPDGVVVSDGDGGNPRVVAPAPENGASEVAWSPSGRWVLFGTAASSEGTGLDLWIVAADGGEDPQMITAEEFESRQAAWQPVLVPIR